MGAPAGGGVLLPRSEDRIPPPTSPGGLRWECWHTHTDKYGGVQERQRRRCGVRQHLARAIRHGNAEQICSIQEQVFTIARSAPRLDSRSCSGSAGSERPQGIPIPPGMPAWQLLDADSKSSYRVHIVVRLFAHSQPRGARASLVNKHRLSPAPRRLRTRQSRRRRQCRERKPRRQRRRCQRSGRRSAPRARGWVLLSR